MYAEQNKAADFFDYYLVVNLGGEIDCDCHFNISSNGEDDPDWIVTEFQLFFLGENVTKMVCSEQVEELIYEQSREVENQISSMNEE